MFLLVSLSQSNYGLVSINKPRRTDVLHDKATTTRSQPISFCNMAFGGLPVSKCNWCIVSRECPGMPGMPGNAPGMPIGVLRLGNGLERRDNRACPDYLMLYWPAMIFFAVSLAMSMTS